eukprot:m.1606008 g.1606008  ORF g.1606008 m.1606008 type:complete len:111 (+) comp25359_c0_seq18:247-579(+)
MLVAAQARLDKAEADARSHETLLRSMQAERDHLQLEMRKHLAAAAARPQTTGNRSRNDDSDDDDDGESLKENLASKTEEAKKLQTLVDQLHGGSCVCVLEVCACVFVTCV